MKALHDEIRKVISKHIYDSMKDHADLSSAFNQPQLTNENQSIGFLYGLLVDPPKPEMGDYAFGCFQIAKVLKKNPAQVAQEIVTQLKSERYHNKSKEIFTEFVAAGPYVNFKVRKEIKGQYFFEKVINQEFFTLLSSDAAKLGEDHLKTMIEYSQPNTHKELHVGHMRNACLGDAIVRILRYCGENVISSTFPGDVGTHVAKCLWYLKFHNQDPVPKEGKGEWLGQIYSKANLKLEDEEKTEKYETNKKQLTEILKQLESKSGEYYNLWLETKKWSVELMNQAYSWSGIQFDQWYWESEVDSDSVRYVKDLYQQGKLIQSEGAVGMDLSDENLGFCLLLKSDGTGLYATKDIELARRKFNDFKIQKSVYVVDTRQALHFKQVFKVLERLGFEQAKNCYHLQYNFVELPDGAMSSRKGNIVPLMKLVKSMEAMVKEKYLSKYSGDWSSAEVDLCAQQVAQGAIKYGMVKIDTNKKIVFDLEEWLKIDGDSGPFIQYSAARIQSLCRKLDFNKNQKVDWSLLNHPAEEALMQGLLQFHTVVLQASETYRPSVLCTYVYDLAKRFNYFYHECSIAQAGSDQLKGSRLALSYVTGEIIKKGLSLIGIPTPERM